MPFFKRNLAGPGHIILNVIRVCNIIALLSVVAASFVMLVKTFTISKFFFFDGVSHLITACISIGLIITEVGIFRRYTATNWPLLSPAHGFVTLAILMIILGVSILGNLNKEATSQKSLGTSMWQCVISSGIVTCIMGIVNIFALTNMVGAELHVPSKIPRHNGPHGSGPRRPSPAENNSLHLTFPLNPPFSATPFIPPPPLEYRHPTQLPHEQTGDQEHQRANR
ncbi:MAG: hypothetical protein Q9163_004903 [Psora crenata]